MCMILCCVLEANKMQFKTHFFVYKQRQTCCLRYIVLIHDDVEDFQNLHDTNVHKVHNRKFHKMATAHIGGLYKGVSSPSNILCL